MKADNFIRFILIVSLVGFFIFILLSQLRSDAKHKYFGDELPEAEYFPPSPYQPLTLNKEHIEVYLDNTPNYYIPIKLAIYNNQNKSLSPNVTITCNEDIASFAFDFVREDVIIEPSNSGVILLAIKINKKPNKNMNYICTINEEKLKFPIQLLLEFKSPVKERYIFNKNFLIFTSIFISLLIIGVIYYSYRKPKNKPK